MTSPVARIDVRVGKSLKLRDIHILATVVDWGSMAKAAGHLGMSQPAVSEAIANLEHAVGARLLDRSPRGVEPTIYGHALLKRGHVMFDELQQGMRDIAFLKDPGVGEVRIGCPESLSAGFVPAIIDRLSRKYPDVVVHVHQTQTAEQEFRELRERAVDLMLGRLLKPLADDDVDMEILCDDHFVVAVGAKNPLADRKRLALAELMDEPWILFPATNVTGAYVAGMFRARGLSPPRKIVSSFSMQLRMHLLATGRYVTVLQNSVLHYNAKRWSLTSLALDLPIEPAPIALFALKNRTLSPVVTRFIEQARTVARSMQPGGGRHRR